MLRFTAQLFILRTVSVCVSVGFARLKVGVQTKRERAPSLLLFSARCLHGSAAFNYLGMCGVGVQIQTAHMLLVLTIGSDGASRR